MGIGILLPTKKAGHHSPAFFVPTAAAASPGQRPHPSAHHPQLCSAERIAEPTNTPPSRHTSCIHRPAPGKTLVTISSGVHGAHNQDTPARPKPAHRQPPRHPTRHPLNHMDEHRDPFWSPHLERVNPSPVKGASRATGVIASDRGYRGRRMKIGAESVPGCGAWGTARRECR